jgi:hypothetical protein
MKEMIAAKTGVDHHVVKVLAEGDGVGLDGVR